MHNKIFDKKIEEIIEKENPYGILLIGSLSRMKKLEFDKVRDIDLFVLTDKKEFKREVVEREDLEFDVSYISTDDLDRAINDRISSIVCVFSQGKILYDSQKNTLKNYVKVIKSIYDEGPKPLTKIDINYERFKITQGFLTLESRVEDELNFNFLKNIFTKDLILSYFSLNNIWMPPDKRMLKSIKDEKLLTLVESQILSKDLVSRKVQLKEIEAILDCILEPFGGRLKFWEKDKFPFDFL